ncbi:MAG: aminoacyl-tRNA hydrolase [Planctomycetota bacterium]
MACRLVLGLGNPGPEYEGTRHNVGFRVVDALAERAGRPWLRRGRALVARGTRDGASFVLARPLTFMNLSGRAARDLLADLGEEADLLVVCDDFHLPLGRLRCRASGSDGGQKGLASVIAALDGRPVPRLRLGIGDPGRQPAEEFVLRRFGRGEQAAVDEMLDRAVSAVDAWLEHGDLDRLMNVVNGPAPA